MGCYNILRTIWKKYSKILPDQLYIKLEYKKHLGYFPNLKNPKTFNEKLQWIKLHDRNPLYTKMVDKFESKKYVANIIGDEYIIPTLGVWESFDEIDFDKLPDKFVLKCTHDSAGILIVTDKEKLDKKKAKKKFDNCLKRNFYYSGREWPYKNVKPRIIAEQYMEDTQTKELRDYKFFCFGGVVKCFKVDFDRFVQHRANYYDENGQLIDYGEVVCPPNFKKRIHLPSNIMDMKSLAEKLSKETSFLRVDFYCVNGKIYFGELTFFPDSGFGKFINLNQDVEMGRWFHLPENKS